MGYSSVEWQTQGQSFDITIDKFTIEFDRETVASFSIKGEFVSDNYTSETKLTVLVDMVFNEAVHGAANCDKADGDVE